MDQQLLLSCFRNVLPVKGSEWQSHNLIRYLYYHTALGTRPVALPNMDFYCNANVLQELRLSYNDVQGHYCLK
jgi:hypothetical protein